MSNALLIKTNKMSSLPPLSLYIHIPWCIRKCPYCDFNSYTITNELPEKDYIRTLLNDLDQDLHYIQNRSLLSIFIGGGTPSLFSAQSIEQLLNAIRSRIPFDKAIEITMEANPGTFETQRFEDFKKAGINRLSLGIQSFQDKKLKALGRIHTANNAIHAIEQIHSIGFKNFNLDLMHDLPNQSVSDALYDLKITVDFQPPHISWYELTIEPNTHFAIHTPKRPSETVSFDIQSNGHQFLMAHDYQHYEVSAYCKPNFQCKHNLNYWTFGDYIGVGAGAHGKITSINSDQQFSITRYSKIKDPMLYLKQSNLNTYTENKMILKNDEIPLEFMMNALRLIDGVPVKLFEQRTGLEIKNIREKLDIAKKENFIEDYSKQLKTTAVGQQFLNQCLQLFDD